MPCRRARALCSGLVLMLFLVWTSTATAQLPPPDYHFRLPSRGAAPALGPQVLSADERAYLATLPEVRVGLARPAFRPYEVIGDDGEISGVHPEMLAYLSNALGIRLRPVVYDGWSNVLEAAKRREVDLLMSMGVNAARTEYLEFTLGASPMVSAIFARRGAGVAPEKARFAQERSNLSNDFIQRHYPEATIVTVENATAALRALAEGRVDLYVGTLLSTLDQLERNGLGGIEVQQLVSYGSGHYHFAVRKDWAPLARILNKGISAVRHEPSREMSAALAALPASVLPPPVKPLTPNQMAVLIERPVWRIGAVRGLALLNDIDANGKHSGIGAEYAEAVARRLGVGLQVMPFADVASMLDALRAGSIDLVPFLTRTDERARQFVYSLPYVEMPYMIVARSDSPLYWDLDSLRGKRLALAPQHPLRELLARRWPEVKVVDVPSGQGAMDAVAEGRADAAVEVKFFANLRIHGDNDGRLRTTAVVEQIPAQFHFASSVQARALVPLVDEVLREMPEAERSRMLRRWVAQDLSPPFPWRRHLPVIGVASGSLLVLLMASAWWMRRLHREVRLRRQSEQRLTDIGAALPCVAWRTQYDGQGRFVGGYYSGDIDNVLGVTLDPARPLIDQIVARLDAGDVDRLLQARSQAAGQAAHFTHTGHYDHPDGRRRWLRAEVVHRPTADGGQILTGYVADVTAEHEMQRRLTEAAESRHLLLASASHELRAPTHTLSLALQAMAGGPSAGAAQPPQLRVAREAARTLTQLLNDVLDAARLDQGEVRIRPQAFALRDLTVELADGLQAWAAEKGLQFEVSLDESAPAVVILDPVRLRQVATNLLSNALKYTAQGRVSMRVGTVTVEGRPCLRLLVEDTGEGIAPERIEHLFTPYAAGDRAGPVRGGSTGLGLSVCRRLVDLMGGRLSLSSTPGKGTRVEVELPLPPEREPAAPGVVLVCDDDDTSRLLLAQMLASRGFAVHECGSGEAALQRWREGGVPSVITDLDMHGLSGLELIQQLRAEEPEARTRVVVCSGSLVPESAMDGSAPLHDAYLAKPVEVELLVQTLAAVGVRPNGA